MLEHRGRGLAFGRRTVWRLHDDRLEHAVEGRDAVAIPLRDIAALYVGHDPAKGVSQRYRCDIEWQGETFTLFSCDMGALSSADGAETYVPLVRALIAAIARTNPRCRFIKGRRLPFSLLMLLIGPGISLFAFGLGAFAGMGDDERETFALLALVAGLLASLPTAWARWPRPFPPESPPADALPAASKG
ncbi:hypothetical protein [Zavarzinia compransoris]|uniref:Uncharacterized protein n=1 Tax=Zavarzinia compransoris TaxID=1264899 RepID=A0A317E7F0_9PROT|nr:hypothetical protein [Zavarzinia compransoris]PWR23048.1 hypothetical protein DKG75_00265 [Zavarzinia compransoris]TDP46407.1 hypothetical protein DES42_104496 [Zavarzinia compransoris]